MPEVPGWSTISGGFSESVLVLAAASIRMCVIVYVARVPATGGLFFLFFLNKVIQCLWKRIRAKQ